MSSDIILEANNIVAGYTDLNVLKGARLEVKEEEIVSIIGPNGAGKSTLIKAIFGLLKPREGQVKLKNRNITGMEPSEIVKNGMSYVPQIENVFPSLSVKENLEMGGVVLDDASAQIENIFELFPPLRERKNARVGTLSGGQQKMVAFGRGIMLDPEVILLDEPSAGLAPKIVDEIFEKVQKINDEGTAIVMVEQNARKALKECDYGYVLEDGKNRFEGEGEELLNNEKVAKLYLGG